MGKFKSSPPSPFPGTQGHPLKTDAVVMADDMRGISLAHCLAKAAKKIVLLENLNQLHHAVDTQLPEIDFIGRTVFEDFDDHPGHIDGYVCSDTPVYPETGFEIHELTNGLRTIRMLPVELSISFTTPPHPLQYIKTVHSTITHNGGLILYDTGIGEIHPGEVITDKGIRVQTMQVIFATKNMIRHHAYGFISKPKIAS